MALLQSAIASLTAAAQAASSRSAWDNLEGMASHAAAALQALAQYGTVSGAVSSPSLPPGLLEPGASASVTVQQLQTLVDGPLEGRILAAVHSARVSLAVLALEGALAVPGIAGFPTQSDPDRANGGTPAPRTPAAVLEDTLALAQALVPDDCTDFQSSGVTDDLAARYSFAVDCARCIADVRHNVEAGQVLDAAEMVDRGGSFVDGLTRDQQLDGGDDEGDAVGDVPVTMARAVPSGVIDAVKRVFALLRDKVCFCRSAACCECFGASLSMVCPCPCWLCGAVPRSRRGR